MMRALDSRGTVVLGLTSDEVLRLLQGEVRVVLPYEGAPAVKVMYAPTYEQLHARFQEHSKAPLPPVVDLREACAELEKKRD